MRKYILSVTVTAMFVAYLIFQRRDAAPLPSITQQQPSNATATQNITDNTPTTQNPPTPTTQPVTQPTTPIPAPTPIPTPAPTTKPTGQYKDGQYTGPSTDAIYGNVQVQATINGGKLTDVQFLDYPQDRGHSRDINSQAMPILTREAIAAQSANVNAVSGATATSQAFIQSLGAALAMAKN